MVGEELFKTKPLEPVNSLKFLGKMVDFISSKIFACGALVIQQFKPVIVAGPKYMKLSPKIGPEVPGKRISLSEKKVRETLLIFCKNIYPRFISCNEGNKHS